MFDFTTHQTKAIMNEVKAMMEDHAEFTRKEIFDYLSEYDDFEMPYSDVKEEFNFIVDRAVKEIGGYKKEFVEDYDGKIVLQYEPLDEDEDDDCDCDDCNSCNEDLDATDSEHEVFNVTVGSKGRVYIKNEMFDLANIFEDEFYIQKYDDEIVLTTSSDDSESYRVSRDNKGGYRFSVKTPLCVDEGDEIKVKIYDGEIVLTAI